MPPPTLMVTNGKGGGDFTVNKLLNGTTLDLTQDGSNVPGSKINLINSQETVNSVLIEAFGKRYMATSAGIRERDEGGDGTWGLVFTPTLAVKAALFSGLHLAFPGGIPTLCWMWHTTSDVRYQIATSTDGTNWTEATVQSDGSGSVDRCGRSIIFGDLMIWAVGRQSNSLTGAVARNLSTSANISWTNGQLSAGNWDSIPHREWHIHKDTLYELVAYNAVAELHRLDGLTWTNVYGGDFTSIGVLSTGRSILFSNGDDLIALVQGDGGDAARAYRLIDTNLGGSPSVINISGVTNISALLPANSDGHTFTKYLDVTDPTSPVQYFWCQQSTVNGGTYDCYQWNGISSATTLLGTGISGANYIFPNDSSSSNDRIPAAPAGRPQFDGLPEETTGGRKRYFRVYGTGSIVTLSLYYNLDREAPNSLATLVASSIAIESGSPATTPTNTSSQITNLTPDDGATLYSIIHNTSADSIGEGEEHSVIMDIV